EPDRWSRRRAAPRVCREVTAYPSSSARRGSVPAFANVDAHSNLQDVPDRVLFVTSPLGIPDVRSGRLLAMVRDHVSIRVGAMRCWPAVVSACGIWGLGAISCFDRLGLQSGTGVSTAIG